MHFAHVAVGVAIASEAWRANAAPMLSRFDTRPQA